MRTQNTLYLEIRYINSYFQYFLFILDSLKQDPLGKARISRQFNGHHSGL